MTKWRDAPDATVVTGAAGWLGTALVHALAHSPTWSRSGPIRALVHDPAERERLDRVADHVEVIVGDLLDPAGLDALFDGLDGAVDVIHTAGVIHPTDIEHLFDVNVNGTRAIVDAARRHDVRRMVHVSSNSPFGTNSHPGDRFRNDEPYHPYYGYGRSKMEAELVVLDAVDGNLDAVDGNLDAVDGNLDAVDGNLDAVDGNLDAVIVRPPWFYGPHQPPRQTTFFRMVRTGRFPVIGGGRQSRSMVYVDNLVDGVIRAELAITPPGRAWWIADPRPYTINEIVETVGRALTDEGFDVATNRFRVPGLVGRVAETADAMIQRMGRYHQQIHVLGELDKNIACDISAATHDLEYRPEIELYEGMRRSIRWCVEQGFEL